MPYISFFSFCLVFIWPHSFIRSVQISAFCSLSYWIFKKMTQYTNWLCCCWFQHDTHGNTFSLTLSEVNVEGRKWVYRKCWNIQDPVNILSFTSAMLQLCDGKTSRHKHEKRDYLHNISCCWPKKTCLSHQQYMWELSVSALLQASNLLPSCCLSSLR